MPTPRSKLISLQATPYYHCVSRCVRRAFLCGYDSITNKNFDHRRAWIEERILFLASVFCIDVCAYAVMSNHSHVVLRINDAKCNELSDMEIAIRWLKICKGTLLVQQFVEDESIANHLELTLQDTLKVYRQRLTDISWFMRMLNEPIARMANQEDECTGRFWEGRFHSQALLDEAALATCMAYVDLNPIRAGIDHTPEKSQFTSVKKRIHSMKQGKQPNNLLPFTGSLKNDGTDGLPFKVDEYINLIDLTGRCFRLGKTGFIDNDLPTILERLQIPAKNWMTLTSQFETSFQGIAGSSASLDLLIESGHRKRRSNLKSSKELFN